MENASKALLMAGGILLAIIILALLTRSFGTISNFQKVKLTEEEQEQLDLELQQEKEYQEEYNAQVLQQLTMLNENISKVEFANQNTNVYLYILCFGFLFAFVMAFIYKTIRKFL